MTDFHGDKAKKTFKMANSKKLRFSTPPIFNFFLRKFQGLVLGLVELIDPKGIDVAQPIWLRDKIYNVARIGRNFDDYPGLQQKSKCA